MRPAHSKPYGIRRTAVETNIACPTFFKRTLHKLLQSVPINRAHLTRKRKKNTRNIHKQTHRLQKLPRPAKCCNKYPSLISPAFRLASKQ